MNDAVYTLSNPPSFDQPNPFKIPHILCTNSILLNAYITT